MAKVLNVDNFNRDYETEYVVAENLDQASAVAIAKQLNERFGGEDAPRFYTVKPDDYKPYVFEGY